MSRRWSRRLPVTCLLILSLALVMGAATWTGCESGGDGESTPAPDGGDAATPDGSVGDATPDDGPPAELPPEPDAEPDAEPPPPACNAILQDCAENENCSYGIGADKPSCFPEGTLEYGEECKGGDCKRGICMALAGTDQLCYQFCKVSAHCDGGADCLELKDTPYRVCEIDDIYDKCNVFNQDCEDDKMGCYVSDGEQICLPPGTSPHGGNCQMSADCEPGLYCLNTRCYRICDANDQNEPCGDAFTPCPFIAWPNVGYCDETLPPPP